MDSIISQLAQSLTEIHDALPSELIYLWLTFRDKKPVSWITLPHSADSREKIFSWLEKAQIVYEPVPDDPDQIIISKNRQNIADVIPVLHADTEEAISQKAILFGYPEPTALSHATRLHPEKYKNQSTNLTLKNFPHPWAPYVLYSVRVGHEMEDSLIAKEWYEIVSKEIPEIHKLFIKMVKENQ